LRNTDTTVIFVSIATLAIFLLAQAKGAGRGAVFLALAGTAIGAVFGAVTQAMTVYFEVAQDLSYWTAGGISGVRVEQALFLLPWTIAGLALAMSIARAVVEHIDKRIHAKTLFATHYHELTELEGRLPGVNNYCVAVSKHDEDIIFLRKIIPGGADQSYGIDVAGLAGVPSPVIERAKEKAGVK